MHLNSSPCLTTVVFVMIVALAVGCVGQMNGDVVPPPTPLDDAGNPAVDADSYAIDRDASDAAHDGDVLLPPPPSDLDCDGIENVLFCDDFESGSIQAGNWTKDTTNGSTIEVSNAKVLQGDYALRVQMSTLESTRAYISLTNIFPVAGNHFFGRLQSFRNGFDQTVWNGRKDITANFKIKKLSRIKSDTSGKLLFFHSKSFGCGS